MKNILLLHKKFYIIFLFLFIIFLKTDLPGQASKQTYYWQNPIPQGNPLFSIHTFDTSNAMTVGTVGTLMKTSNGGKNWTVIHKLPVFNRWIADYQPTENWIYSIYFVNRSVGYAAGGYGMILKTIDGGETWEQQYSGVNVYIQSVYFINMDLGWAAGWNGTILKTTNGGESWDAQVTNSNAQLHSIHFMNKDTGWAVGERGVSGSISVGELLRTTNGGAEWTRINLGINNRLWGLNFKGASCYFTGWSGLIGRSIDYGRTFQTAKTGVSILIYDLDFPSDSIGYAGGEYGTLLKTTDGGSNWKQLKPVTTDHIYSISFIDTLVGWFVGDYGNIYKTRDGGATWERQTNNQPGVDLTWEFTREIKDYDYNNNYIWTVGVKGLILRSTDNGVNWSDYSYNVTNTYNSVSFPTQTTGYISGDNGKILKSTTGGTSWQTLNVPLYDYKGIHFTSEMTGYAVGNTETIIKTTNGGATWTTLHTGPAYQLNCIHFPSKDTGFAAGYNVILRTTDGGATWTEHRGMGNLLSIKFLDNRFGIASGVDGLLYKTIDGGNNWIKLTSAFADEIAYSVMMDSLFYLGVGKWGRILKSTDGGYSWNIYQTNGSNFFNCAHFTDRYSGILFGKGCTIMRYFDGDAKPMIICEPSELRFIAPYLGNTPSMKWITVSSFGGALNWDFQKDTAAWFDTYRINESTLAIRINTTSYKPDTTYTSFITITDPNAFNSPQKVIISYYIYIPGNQPEIFTGGIESLYFEAEQNGPIPHDQDTAITITNKGKGTLIWETTKKATWFDVTPPKGQDSTRVAVSVNTTILPINVYTDSILISSAMAVNSPQYVSVIYSIYSPPMINFLDDSILNFTAVQRGPLPGAKSVRIANPGRRPFSWVSSRQNPANDWYGFSPETGGEADSIVVNMQTTDLPTGKYTDKLILTSQEAVNSPVSITINYDILPVSILSFPRDSVVFDSTELGETMEITIPISNPGTGVLSVTSQIFTGAKPEYFGTKTSTPFDLQGNGNKDIVFTFKPLRRGRAEATLEITSNALLQNNGKISIPFIGYGKDTKPPVITLAGEDTAKPIKAGTDALIKASATDYSGVLEFKILYRQSNELWDTTNRKRDFPSNQDASLYIPGSSITQNGADFKVIAKDSVGNVDTLVNPISKPEKKIKFFSYQVEVSDRNAVPAFSTPKVTTQLKDAKRFYRMFSTPLNYNNVKAKDIWGNLGEHRYQWRFRVPLPDNPDGTNFIDGEYEVLKPGISYFIITRNTCTIQTPPGVTQRFDLFYRDGVDLQPGYNFIGNPFAFEIPQKKLRLLDTTQLLENSSWYFNGMSSDPWLQSIPFQTWGGYCIKVVNQTKLIVEEEIPDKTTMLKKETVDGWKLQISADNEDEYDNFNYIGMKHSSKDVFDKNDIFEPPRLDDRFALFIPHDDWNKYSGEYSGDFRAFNSEGAAWDIRIICEKDKLINLNISGITDIPAGYNILIYDKDFERIIPTSAGLPLKLQIGSDKGVRNLKIAVGTNEFIQNEKTKYKSIPKEFRLFQNFPNPFNSQTTLFYQLPVDGKVKIDIYSILGEHVTTLIDKEQKAGSYEIIFDAGSKRLASGVYFYRLKVTGTKEFTTSQKMILMK